MPPDRGHHLVAAAEPAVLDRVHALLDEVWQQHPDVSEPDRVHLGIALAEIVGNVVQHGAAGEPLDVGLDVEVHPDRVEAQVHDAGPHVDVDLTSATLPDELAESGRGLALAVLAVDELVYRRDGQVNRWRIVRRRTAC